MTNPERRERIRKVLNEHRHEADFTNTVIALEALMPEVMSEEEIKQVLKELGHKGIPNIDGVPQSCPICEKDGFIDRASKALTIAKPQEDKEKLRVILSKVSAESWKIGVEGFNPQVQLHYIINNAVNEIIGGKNEV